MFRLLFLLSSISLTITAPALSAQEVKSIEGKVVDAKGKTIPAGIVRLSSKDPGPPLETLTEIDGTFGFPNLPPGAYQVTVEMAGFQKLTLEGVDPSAEESRRLNLVLKRSEAPPPPSTEISERRPPRGSAETANRSEGGRGFQEVGLDGVSDVDSQKSASPGAGDHRVAPAGEDNSDRLVISGSSTASFGAGDWNDPQFRERMMEMANRMGFGGGEGG